MSKNQKFHDFSEALKDARLYCEREDYANTGRCLLTAFKIAHGAGCQGLTEKMEELILRLIEPAGGNHVAKITTFDGWLRDLTLLLDTEEN